MKVPGSVMMRSPCGTVVVSTCMSCPDIDHSCPPERLGSYIGMDLNESITKLWIRYDTIRYAGSLHQEN